MAANRPVSDAEREFVRAVFGQMGVAEMARRLGRSRSTVNNIVRAEGLREKCARPPRPEAPPGAAPPGALGRLAELREMLRAALADAKPSEMPGLAREYRATMEAMERMGGDAGGEEGRALDALAEAVAGRMPS